MISLRFTLVNHDVHPGRWREMFFCPRGALLWRSLVGEAIYIQKTLWAIFMDGIQLPQGYSHFEEAVYFISFSSQKFKVLILSTSEGWKA